MKIEFFGVYMSIADELERLQNLREKGVLGADELAKAKAKVLGESGNAIPGDAPTMMQQFRRSKSDRILGGVCGGLGKITGMPSWGWRILFLLCIVGYGFGLLAYVLMWLFVPEETV
jgi:phage shock protein C